jgi:hypothetical protein|tara:strand:+ start:161 stop:484 length:324 start_codon:yes stop_codon:yes gene_type:complete
MQANGYNNCMRYAVMRTTYMIMPDPTYIGSKGASIGGYQNFIWTFDSMDEALDFACQLLEEPFFQEHKKKFAQILRETFAIDHGGEKIVIGYHIEDTEEDYRKKTLH